MVAWPRHPIQLLKRPTIGLGYKMEMSHIGRCPMNIEYLCVRIEWNSTEQLTRSDVVVQFWILQLFGHFHQISNNMKQIGALDLPADEWESWQMETWGCTALHFTTRSPACSCFIRFLVAMPYTEGFTSWIADTAELENEKWRKFQQDVWARLGRKIEIEGC